MSSPQFKVRLELLPTGVLAWLTWPRGRGQPREGSDLGLKLQYFGHLMRRADSLEKTLMLGKIEVRKRRGWQKMRWKGLWWEARGPMTRGTGELSRV